LQEVSPWILLGMAGIVALALMIFAFAATGRLEKIPTTPLQGFAELVVSSLNNYVVGIVGPDGGKYTPFIGTLFVYILGMNLLGLIPGLHSPTSNLSITASVALVVFVYYNYVSIKVRGAKAWFMHLLGEPLWLCWLMFPIHVIGELARPLSLAIRLYGNIFGEETVMMVLAGMSLVIIPYFIAIPSQLLMMFFGVFTAFVQSLVFISLTAIYLGIGIADHEEH
jgi:F-type H+-transporting ATPase subunit a